MKNIFRIIVYFISIVIIFIFSLRCNMHDRECRTITSITKVSNINDPYEVKGGICYKIKISGSHKMYYKFKSKGGYGLYIDINNFSNNLQRITLSFWDNDSSFKNYSGGINCGWLFSFMPVEDTYEFYNKTEGDNYYYFTIEKLSRNKKFGYDLYVEEKF